MSTVEVFWDTTLVGVLTVGEGRLPSVRFQYDQSWLGRRGAFAVDPELPLEAGPFTRDDSLFGAFRDSAPDEWGRGLLARSLRRDLGEVDYLLGVQDETRQGALRYLSADGRWCSDESRVPVVLDLPTLRRAAREAETSSGPPLRELAAAGAGTGGARPKVVVRDDDRLWIAKFGRRDDLVDVQAAEHAIALLSARAGISTSVTSLRRDAGESLLLVERFDRDAQGRLGYLSALSLLEADVGARRANLYDYLELADVLGTFSSRPAEDLAELWRRIAFGALVRNTDDHMRNHGFLRRVGGWRLAPAFDVNVDVRSWTPFVSTIDEEDGDGRLEALLRIAEYFRLSTDAARGILAAIVDAVDGFPAVAHEVVDDVDTREQVVAVVREGAARARALLS